MGNPKRVHVECVSCKQIKAPVVGMIALNGYTESTYVCLDCRAAFGDVPLKAGSLGIVTEGEGE